MEEQRFRAVFSDREFINSILELNTGEKVRKKLKDKGIVLNVDELDQFAAVLVNALEERITNKVYSKAKKSNKNKFSNNKIQNISDDITLNVSGGIRDEEICSYAELVANELYDIEINQYSDSWLLKNYNFK